MNKRRIVITGMGAVTPLGDTVEALFQSQSEGRSGIRRIQIFDPGSFPTQIAAQVLGFDLGRYLKHADKYAKAGPNTKFALAAARPALEDAGLLDASRGDRTRFGVYLGAGEGKQDFSNVIYSISQSADRQTFRVNAPQFSQWCQKLFDARHEQEQEMHTCTAHVADEFDLRGPNYSCLTACAASSQAIGEGADLIRRGEADVVLGGGAHSMIHPFGVTGFNLLTALSTENADPAKASCPFDARRGGFVMGEGGGAVVLEELEHAKKRGAKIYAELTGYGTTADAFRVTDSHEHGRGAIACMKMALARAGLAPSDIGYINAHGTSTQVNDRVETLAIKQVFGEYAKQVPVSSSKSMLGHLIAAAGAVELIICVMALQRGVLPPTINYEVPDPDCDLDYIPNQAREKRVEHILSNSFGFGGQNVSLIISRYRD
jgi:3-oxoacyl-[acyl-carrier-protein] synthase II